MSHTDPLMLVCAEREAVRRRAQLPVAAVGVAPRLGFESPALRRLSRAASGKPPVGMQSFAFDWQLGPG